MDDLTVHSIKRPLDCDLSGEAVGLVFGVELFKEFSERGWLPLEFSGEAGTPSRGLVSVYGGSHVVGIDPSLPERDYKIGMSDA